MSNKGHSEDYFGSERDFWWNKDYFDLLAKRWELSKYSKILDVGCGRCHWSKLISNYLKQPAEVYAMDYDPKWANGDDIIREYFAKNNVTVNFMQGNAEELPFPDNHFDVVTCQTVLIHLKNPIIALKEMKRVLKKDGILICAEPSNIAGALIKDSLIDNESIEETLKSVKYHLIYEKGKKLLGEGDNSIGDLLPGLFAKVGLDEIRVYLSDKATPMFPPYDSDEEIALLNTLKEWIENDEGQFDYHQALSYFMAVDKSNSNIDFFNEQFQKNKERMKEQLKYIKNWNFYTGGAYVMYVISAKKIE